LIIKLDPYDWKDWENDENHTDHFVFNKSRLRKSLCLTDGGVYDNLGLERVWDRYATVLVSDAGAPFRISENSSGLKFSELARSSRAVSIITEQAHALRKRWLINDLKNGLVKGTYWGISTHIRDYHLEMYGSPPPLLDDNKVTHSLARIRTRLNRFSADEQEQLINWGYSLADAAMRRHVVEKETAPGKVPYLERS
jgi:NTE family protein